MTVLIVDDNADMRFLMRSLFEIEKIDIVGEAVSAATAIESWRVQRPDVVVMDLRMGDGTGLDAAHEILGEDPSAAIILFSAFLSDDNIAEAAAVGVECVSKDELTRLATMVHALAA